MYQLKNISQDKRPREKLIHDGPDILSNEELLAIIFVTGTRNEDVLSLSKRVFQEYGTRSILNIKDVGKVMGMLGLGKSKACQLVSLFELGRRFYQEQSSRMPTIRTPEDVYNILRNLEKQKKEELRALYINSRQKVIREELISLGSENMNIVSPKEILQPAIEILARGILIAHNHPSGDNTPSEEDVLFTKRLIEGCEIIGIEFLDHIVIGNGYMSMKEMNII